MWLIYGRKHRQRPYLAEFKESHWLFYGPHYAVHHFRSCSEHNNCNQKCTSISLHTTTFLWMINTFREFSIHWKSAISYGHSDCPYTKVTHTCLTNKYISKSNKVHSYLPKKIWCPVQEPKIKSLKFTKTHCFKFCFILLWNMVSHSKAME